LEEESGRMKRRINVMLKEPIIKQLDDIAKKNKKTRSKTIEEIIEEKLRRISSYLK
jgi:metal-responsive CopG/Arc/MetJ family transcriptional regulator